MKHFATKIKENENPYFIEALKRMALEQKGHKNLAALAEACYMHQSRLYRMAYEKPTERLMMMLDFYFEEEPGYFEKLYKKTRTKALRDARANALLWEGFSHVS